jgi:16S rRNA (cytidine1402-2'-O)-methyltransferase
MNVQNKGTLSIVGMPIGNKEDITLRALRVLREADFIFCEDTREAGKICSLHKIERPLRRLDANTERIGAGQVIELLEEGKRIAYISDAGTPGISDPGSFLVSSVRSHFGESVTIESIPGASSLTAALSIAGLDARAFTFLGFLPHKKGRLTALKDIVAREEVVVLYESPHRIAKLLGELQGHIGERKVVIARELTKMFEEVKVGTAQELQAYVIDHKKERGEYVVMIDRE